MPALEDQWGHLAGAKLWTAISEQDVLECRDGYRPRRGAWEAVRARPCELQYGRYGSLGEAAIPGFFDHMDHAGRLAMRRVRMADRALLKLSRQWLKAGGEVAGQVGHPATGPPQGGTRAPGLAHVYRHDAWDLWFDKVVTPPGRGEAVLCRYADDGGCALRYQDDAERCSRGLPQRLKQFHLQGAPANTHVRRLSRLHPRRKRRCTFRGFAVAWRPDRHGVARVRRRPARQKRPAACHRLTAWIKHPRHLPERAVFQRLHARLRGHDNYYGVRGTARALTRFFRWAMDGTCKWLKRRGGKQSRYTWEQCTRVLDRVKLARPCIMEVKRRRVFA